MNLINAAATFVGEAQTETGVRCMEMKIPVQGSKAVEVPVFLIPPGPQVRLSCPKPMKKAARSSFTGRLYPQKRQQNVCCADTTAPNCA